MIRLFGKDIMAKKKEPTKTTTITKCLNCDGEGSANGKDPCSACNGAGKVSNA